MAEKIDEKKQKYKSAYRDLKFKSKKHFQVWLNKIMKYEISFVDKGQDCLKWFLDEGGEVLNSNLQSSVWNGELVDLFSLKVGKGIEIMDVENQRNEVLDFIVEKIKIY